MVSLKVERWNIHREGVGNPEGMMQKAHNLHDWCKKNYEGEYLNSNPEMSITHEPADARLWMRLASFHCARGLGYLVDPASSHMLVSKIKPCRSKYKLK